MSQNEGQQDRDYEKGLLEKDNDNEASTSHESYPLRTFPEEAEPEKDTEQTQPLLKDTNVDLSELQIESDERENERLEARKRYLALKGLSAKYFSSSISRYLKSLNLRKESRSTEILEAIGQTKYQPKWTELHQASARGLSDRVQELLDAGEDPNVLDDRGRTALDVAGIAFYQGIEIKSLFEILQLLLNGKGIFNTMKGTLNILDTPLHTAVELGCIDSVKALLDAGAKVTSLNSTGLSPLHICVTNKHEELLKILLTYNCNVETDSISDRVNIRDHAGFTLLQAAVVTEWLPGVKVLLEAGANITAITDLDFDRYNNVVIDDLTNYIYRLDELYEPPLHLAANVGNQQILRKLLIKDNKAVNHYNLLGQSPLFIAIRGGHIGCITCLINMGADIMKVSNEKQNALHVAVQFGQTRVVEFILENCDLKYKMLQSYDNQGYAPVHTATACNRVDCLTLLAKDNAYLRLRTKGYLKVDWTPLHIAAAKNYPEAAEVILNFDQGAIDDVDHRGCSPLHLAATRRNREVMIVILRKGAVLSSRIKKNNRWTYRNKKDVTALEVISTELPNPAAFLEEVFDSFIETKDPEFDSESENMIHMDYGVFTKVDESSQTTVLDELVRCGQRKLLMHPLVESLIYIKWATLRMFYYIIVGIHTFFAVSLYAIIIDDFYDESKTNANNYRTYLLPSVAVFILMEIIYINAHKLKYFSYFENYIKLGSILLALILLCSQQTSWKNDEWSRHVASAALLVTWAQMMFVLSRSPYIGFQVWMFGKVGINIFKILFTFTFLILAFSLSFMIQYHSKPPFDGPWASLIKTVVMMTSEFDYGSLFGDDHKNELMTSKKIVHVLFILFVLLVSIVFMNFMVGIAVSDINELRYEGNIRRLEKQVEFLKTLDILAFGFLFKKLLHKEYVRTRFVKNTKIKPGVTKTWTAQYHYKVDDESDSMYEKEVRLPPATLDVIFTKIKAVKDQKKEEKEVKLYRRQIHSLYNTIVTNDNHSDKKHNLFQINKFNADVKNQDDHVKRHFLNKSTQTDHIQINARGPRWNVTRVFTRKRLMWQKRILQKIKSRISEETKAMRTLQRKKLKKLERMFRNLRH